MKQLSLCVSLLLSSVAFAQKGIDAMVQAERAFAAYALANGTKDAFIKFADSTGFVFEKGQAINARTFWRAKEKSPGILNWRPRFAEIAASGDFGYTTGPWTFQPQTISDSIAATGHFFTVWHLAANGEWQFLLDMGTSKAPVDSTSSLQKIQVPDKQASSGTDSNFLKAEKAFISAYKQDPKQAYKTFLSHQSILNREQMEYATLAADQEFLIASYLQPVTFNPVGTGIASSGDLGYVYGEAIYDGKKQNYLHIWRHEPKGWKIALELIQH
jgi:ketosteroid isomerase-like protein